MSTIQTAPTITEAVRSRIRAAPSLRKLSLASGVDRAQLGLPVAAGHHTSLSREGTCRPRTRGDRQVSGL
jgi:hypothetical protein